MRVLHVIGSLNPAMGGLPGVAISLAAAQASEGAEVGVLHFSSTREEAEIGKAFGGVPGVEGVERLAVFGGGVWEKAFCARAMDEMRAFGPDVIHTHGLWEPILRRVQGEALRVGVPVVMTPHGMMHPWQDRFHRLLKPLLIHGLGWGRCWRRVDCVQALTELEAEHLRARGHFREIRVIPNGVFPDEGEVKGERKPMVLFLGRLGRGKEPDVLLEGFSRIAEKFPWHTLVLAGPDYGLRGALKRQAATAGLSERVRMPGAVYGKEKRRLLREAEVFCLPSRAEGFSLSLLEAGMAGAPLLLSRACWFQGLAEAEGAYSFELTPEALAEALREVLTNREEALERAVRARELILARYTWPLIAKEMLVVYAGMLS